MYCSIFRANNIKNEIWSYISRNLICAIVPAFFKIFIYSSNVTCKNTQWFSLLLWFIVAQKPNPPITHRHTRVQEHASSYKLRAAVNGFSGTHWYLLPWWKIIWASFVSASPRLCLTLCRLSLSLSLSLSLPFISLLLYLSTSFFPRWEHFYGNWSPRNNSSWCTCVPDLLMSRTLNANRLPQQPHERLLHVQMLLSFTVDAADIRPLPHRSRIEPPLVEDNLWETCHVSISTDELTWVFVISHKIWSNTANVCLPWSVKH